MTKPDGPSAACKAQGLPSLAYVCKVADVSPETARNWFYNNPKRFEVMVLGVKAKMSL